MEKQYILFIDESGVANLNHGGKYFILSSVLIAKDDFNIIEGYLRLLKRKFLGKDLVNIHATDLCERTYQKYRRLKKPMNHVNPFLNELCAILRTVPYKTGLYSVDKDVVRSKFNFTPSKGKTIPNTNMDLPYEMCAFEAFFDFSQFLAGNKAYGEIVVESRFRKDGEFVRYFDIARSSKLAGNIYNPHASNVKERINSITICNKKIVDGGIEISDICAYAAYRVLEGDPKRMVKVSTLHINNIHHISTGHSYLKSSNGNRIKIKNVN